MSTSDTSRIRILVPSKRCGRDWKLEVLSYGLKELCFLLPELSGRCGTRVKKINFDASDQRRT